MTTVDGAADCRHPPAPLIPPWPLLWLLVWAAGLPQSVRTRLASWDELGASGSYGEFTATTSFALLRAALLVAALPDLLLLGGLVAVLAPALRARWVEYRLGLRVDDRPIVLEIRRFLTEHARGVEVRVNAARADRDARAYARSWRRPRIAVFAGFLKLWRADRAAAEAVLLHEVAHVRTGDHLVLGVGSPVTLLVRSWLLLVVLGAAIPVTLVVLGEPTATAFVGQALISVAGIPSLLVLLVAALWCAELAADRSVRAEGRGDALVRALRAPTPSRPWWRSPAAVVHPPRALRPRAATSRFGGDRMLVFGWPCAFVLRVALTSLVALAAFPLAGMTGTESLTAVIQGASALVLDFARLVVPTVLLLAVWPWSAPLWTRLWCAEPTMLGVRDRRTVWIAALVVALVYGAAVLTALTITSG